MPPAPEDSPNIGDPSTSRQDHEDPPGATLRMTRSEAGTHFPRAPFSGSFSGASTTASVRACHALHGELLPDVLLRPFRVRDFSSDPRALPLALGACRHLSRAPPPRWAGLSRTFGAMLD